MQPTIIERAFELAKSGRVSSVEDIARQLKREHYEAVLSHLSGNSIRRQLTEVIKQSASVPYGVAEGSQHGGF